MDEENPRQRIIEYYRQTERHYRSMWGLDRNMALHYGFWGRGARNHDEALAHLNLELADRAKITSADRVLDAGCGVGGSSVFLAKTLGCSVVGINIVDRQLELARQNAERLGVSDRVRFENRDYTDTQFETGSFDVVWFCESTCHAEDTLEPLQEAARLLRPGGRLVACEVFRTSEDMRESDEQLMAKLEDCWAIPRFDTVEAFRAKLEQAGFGDIHVTDDTDNVAPSARRLARQFYFGIAIKTLRRLWKRSTSVKFKNLWSARYQEKARRRGLWSYNIVSANKV